MFILHTEHELNCSTAAIRHLSSSGVDIYTTIAGATGALYGPKHGGANEAVLRMLEQIGKKSNIPQFIRLQESSNWLKLQLNCKELLLVILTSFKESSILM